MNRREFLGATGLAAVGFPTRGRGEDYDTLDVPGDASTIQDAVDAASPGDLVLVAPGTYRESVEVTTPGVTVRGLDRNEVVVDGEFERYHGVDVEADGVAVENMTVRNCDTNGVYWRDVDGFRGSYLTAHTNGRYGVYAYAARDGRFEHSYASGHPDAGFYLGRAQPAEAVIADVVAEYNGVGYSGTSTGADLTIRDSVWRRNVAGIAPNTLNESEAPQRSSRIVGNEVYENDNEDAPTVDYVYQAFGSGIVLLGGSDNLVEDNVVEDHEHFGIVAQENVVSPSGNLVRNNAVSGSGVADLALGAPADEGNEFRGNRFESSLPSDIEADASAGDERVTEVFEAQRQRVEDESTPPGGNYREQPEPDDRPTMPDPEAPPRPATRSSTWDPDATDGPST